MSGDFPEKVESSNLSGEILRWEIGRRSLGPAARAQAASKFLLRCACVFCYH